MRPHERLDGALTRRIDELDLTWQELADKAGVHEVTLRAQRRGENKPSARTKRRLEDALQWDRGSVDAILNGGDPNPLGAPATPREQLRADVSELEAELEALLAERQGRPLNETQRDIAVTWTQTLTRALDALNEEAG